MAGPLVSQTGGAAAGKPKGFFSTFANSTAQLAGKPATFLLSVVIVIAWAVSGPFFHFSDTWQLVINTGTTIVTFLMVFVIQNAQNRDAQAFHLKLDELILALSAARNETITAEEMGDDELHEMLGDAKRKAKIT